MSSITTVMLSLLFLLCSTLNFRPLESHNPHNFPISSNHSMTPQETRISQQLHRSFSRMNYLAKLHQTASTQTQTQIQASHPDFSTKVTFDPKSELYIASYSIGTPPQKVVAFIDTASDLIWTNSKTVFKPGSSTTYTVLPCDNKKFCQRLNQRTCKGKDPKCTYTIKYADQASTSGVLSEDKFSFGADPGQSSSIDVGLLSFGDASDANSTHFEGEDINGCLAISGVAPFSFINQLGIQKFSHCFIKSSSKSSTMHFGSKAVIPAKDSIPLVDTKYYYVKLDGISVGDTKVDIKGQPGRIYVDTAATYSLLKRAVYNPFLKLIKEKVAKPAEKNPPHPYLEYCFKATKADVDKFPKVTFSFNSNNVNVSFGNDVTYLEFGGGIWCLAILPSTNSVLGNFQLANLNVGYDIAGKIISFTPTNCAP
ncbi:Beta-site APP-cleaving enzyme [Stylosanthes scabra]|uniref:Beta-site APP-cleaving enzyme n=1 Tax=Stylosanthes scabra TaxID=79078 RepID=A0ABU6R5F7_9FABA|nr:Beta-site APP-cleaving enzyme [Stylosanthes scabra]